MLYAWGKIFDVIGESWNLEREILNINTAAVFFAAAAASCCSAQHACLRVTSAGLGRRASCARLLIWWTEGWIGWPTHRDGWVGCSALMQAAGCSCHPLWPLGGWKGDRAGSGKKRKEGSSYGNGFRALGKAEMSFVVLSTVCAPAKLDCRLRICSGEIWKLFLNRVPQLCFGSGTCRVFFFWNLAWSDACKIASALRADAEWVSPRVLTCPAVVASPSQSRHPNALPAYDESHHVLDESTRLAMRVKREREKREREVDYLEQHHGLLFEGYIHGGKRVALDTENKKGKKTRKGEGEKGSGKVIEQRYICASWMPAENTLV